MSIQESLKLDDQICFALYACSREVMKQYRPILEEFDLTYTQYVTLLALWEKEHVTVKELGARLYLDSGTLTPLLKKLEAAGLIQRIRDRQDERSVIISLTAEGRDLEQKAQGIPCRLFEQSGVKIEELQKLHAQLYTVLAAIKEG
jgi:DNA-binding MarR family transcriptional regulator